MRIFDLSCQKRIDFVRKLISLFYILGIILSYNLWITGRSFPLLPLVDFLLFQSHIINYLLIFLLVALLSINIFLYKRIINLLIIFLLIVLLVADQNRWQPWVYLYFLMLLPFGIGKNTNHSVNAFPYLQIILIGVYAWSGIHKLNPNFINGIFPEILTKLFWFTDSNLIDAIKPVGYLIPATEIAIAIGLWTPKFRNKAVCAAILSHIFILFYLSPFGINSNSVVYPWNLAMMGLVPLSFYHAREEIKILSSDQTSWYNLVGALLIWIMPFFNFFGLWDSYLSFSLYSGKINAFYIVIADDELSKIDGRLKKYFLHIEGLHGGEIIDINKWSMEELNVPFYPETRALKKMGKPFCLLGIPEDQLYFLEFELPLKKGRFTRFTCKDLNR